MGSFASRQNTRNEETDIVSNQLYKYPAKTGNYFANYFVMGGEKFDVLQPESYLFGDNMDLNFLGSRPAAFPYPPPQSNDPTRPLKCLVNIRRESIRFVRANDHDKNLYNLEFCFDSDVRCSIRIYYFCTEEITSMGVTYNSKDEKLTSDVYFYKRGCNQMFLQNEHVFDPSLYSDDELLYNIEKDTIPVAIQCIALEGLEEARQSHTTIAIIEKHSDGSYSLKALKQKLFVDGLCYLLQEIYGIENKTNETNKEMNDNDIEDSGLECVICMSDMRDTLILPCRHLCLCQACADSLRYQANNCPICRSPFRALLQIKALQKYCGQTISTTESTDGIPVGFERISLIEALNGPGFMNGPYSDFALVKRTSDSSNIGPTITIYSSRMRKNCGERLARALRVKANLCSKDSCDEDLDTKADASPIPRGRLACHDTEDEDKSSSITDHLLHEKSILRSPDTAQHTNEISNTEDEMPDEDSDAEKLSPLLEKVIDSELIAGSRKESSILDAMKEKNDCHAKSESNLTDRKISELGGGDQCKRSNSCCSIKVENTSTASTKNRSTKELSRCSSDATSRSPQNSLLTDKGSMSLPGTPASIASIRSSNESYSSSSSSRRLLSQNEKPMT